MPVPADNPLTAEGVALGKRLFYDKCLSINNSMSCSSCHQQEYAFAQPTRYSTGVDGKEGNINAMSLVNLGWSSHFFWNGRARSMEEQIDGPITNPVEMHSNWDTVLHRLNRNTAYLTAFNRIFGQEKINRSMVEKVIAQFERTIVSFNSRFDRYYFDGDVAALTEEEEKGLDLFMGAATCNHCHSDVLLTDNYTRNNGLDLHPDSGYAVVSKNPEDIGKFKVPTLRNIALTAPYMHDGRFKTLDEVLDFYSEHIQAKSPNLDIHLAQFGSGLDLTREQKKAIIAFLRTLTDTTLIHNPFYTKG